jgi:hypothetical protein
MNSSEATTRRRFLRQLGVAGTLAFCGQANSAPNPLPPGVARLSDQFVLEALPEGGVDKAKSLWQKPGRGSAVGGNAFAGDIDPRYFRFEAEALYRISRLTGEERCRRVADAQAHYMAKSIGPQHPMWAIGNALELLGLYHQEHPQDDTLVAAARKLVDSFRARRVSITTLDGITFGHFPCGYGVAGAKDAGWTNDLSMVGSGLVWAYELTRDGAILSDALSFAEYFVQPWRPQALGTNGYWRCGTWHDKLGSWVIGPSHYSGFESTDVFADEASWVFSTVTCIDFLLRLYLHKPDPRFLDRSLRAAQWTFRACQFDDGAVGMCGRDDKWLGFTGDAVTQVALLQPHAADIGEAWPALRRQAERAHRYLAAGLDTAKLEQNGVEWVQHKSSTNPLVNVATLWASALLGWLNGRDSFTPKPK